LEENHKDLLPKPTRKSIKRLIIAFSIAIPFVAIATRQHFSNGTLQPASISLEPPNQTDSSILSDITIDSDSVLSTLSTINDNVLSVLVSPATKTLLYTMAPDLNPTNVSSSITNYTGLKRGSIRYDGGGKHKIFYGTNYSSVDLLFARDCKIGRLTPMLDVRGHYFSNNRQFATNVGVVGRYIKKDLSKIFGVNAYWDHRRGKRGNYNGLGLGVESFGHKWDFRANAYIPLGRIMNREECVFDDFTDGFFAIVRKKEVALYGANIEVGRTFTKTQNSFLYIAAGPYYFNGGCDLNIKGGEIRIHPQYKDYLSLDVMVSYDNEYHLSVQGEVAITLPLYDLSEGNNCGFSKRIVYQPVKRFEVMQLGRCCCWETNFD
jgi:hypothetical protein